MAAKRICSIPGCGKSHFGNGYCQNHNHRYRVHGDPLKGKAAQGEPLAWLHRHLDHKDGACLTWPFAGDGRGYGQLNWNGKRTSAHRVMCELAQGEPPFNNAEAAHDCGNGARGCVNPGHLSWKTRAENEADKSAHGTSNVGERNGRAVLSESDVRMIRRDSRPSSELAKEFGVSAATICGVRHYRSWSWLV